jgi:hypothetical protein
MNVLCSATACPVLLSTTCVFYEGENLIYTGINTNDSVQEALQKIDEAFSNNILSINAILPISVTSGPNPTISISQASATSNGYISSVDWNIFNNKVPSTRTLTINGTTYDLSANRSWTIPSDNIYNTNGTLTGNRTLNTGGFDLIFTGTDTASANLARFIQMTPTLVAAANNDVLVGLDINPTFTNGAFTTTRNIGLRVQSGRVMIGAEPAGDYPPTLSVSSNNALYSTTPNHGGLWVSQANSGNYAVASFYGNNYPSGFHIGRTGSAYPGMGNKSFLHSAADIWITQSASGLPDSANATMIMFGATKNITIGGTTDAGYKLDVNGTARVQLPAVGASSYFVLSSATTTTTNSYFGVTDLDNAFGRAQYSWGTNLRFNGTTFVRDNTNSGAWMISQGCGNDVANHFFRIRNYNPNVGLDNSAFVIGGNGSIGINKEPNLSIRLDVNGSVRGTNFAFINALSGSFTNYDLTNVGGSLRLIVNDNANPIFYVRSGSDSNITFGSFTFYTSAQLAIDSTTKGFLQPRMTTVQRDAIASPATGLQVYNSTTNTNDYYNGTSWLSEGNVSGSGVAGQVAYWNGTGSQTGSANFTWNNASSILTVGGTTTSDSGVGFRFVGTASNSRIGVYDTNKIGVYLGNTLGAPSIYGYNYTTGSAAYLKINEFGGNVLIGTATDGGQRLQVQGDAFIKGSGNTSGTTALTLQNSDGTNMFRVNNAGSLLFGTAAPRIYPMDKATTSISLTGAGLSFFDTNTGSGNTFYFTGSDYIHTSGTAILLNATRLFWPTSGTGTLIMSNIGVNINQTGGANGITRGLYVNPTLTAAADWRSIEWSNNSGWGLYGAGTANNYLGGRLLINTTTVGTFNLDVNGTARVSGALKLFSGGTAPANNYPLNAYVSSGGIASFEYGTTGFLQFVRAGASAGVIYSSRGETYDICLVAGNYGSTLGLAVRPANIGGVKIGGDNTTIVHENSAILNVESTTKGFLPPRMTTTQKNAIGSPAAGLQVYDTTLNQMSYYNGTTWINF